MPKAAVDIQEVPPVTRTSDDVLLAKHEGARVESVDQDAEPVDGSPITTTHTRPGTHTMYKPGPRMTGYSPRTVSSSAIGQLLRQGWQEVCGDCRKPHLDKAGEHSKDPNLCEAKEPVKVRVCPLCSHRIYDNLRFDAPVIVDEDGENDPNVITDDGYEASTPESRTKDALDLHLWVDHARQAHEMKVPRPPEAVLPTTEANKR